MRLLLDTHALIWFCEGHPKLSPTARAAMEDGANERHISHAVPWEMAIKLSVGKLQLKVDYDVIFPGVPMPTVFKCCRRAWNTIAALSLCHDIMAIPLTAS